MYIDNFFFKFFKILVGGKVFDSYWFYDYFVLIIINFCVYVDIKESLFIWLKVYFGCWSVYVLNSVVNFNV